MNKMNNLLATLGVVAGGLILMSVSGLAAGLAVVRSLLSIVYVLDSYDEDD